MQRKTELTNREVQIMLLILKDLNNREIATQLEISMRTVETHRKNIFSKVKCNSAMSLLRWAMENKIEAKYNQNIEEEFTRKKPIIIKY